MKPARALALLIAISCVPPEVNVDDPVDTPIDTVDPETTPTPTPGGEDPVAGMPFHDTGVQQNGMLLAGRWRDLDHWQEFSDLIRFNSDWYDTHAIWGFAPTQRFRVQVRDGIGPVPDARVLLYRRTDLVYEARANALGIAEVYGGLFDLSGGPWSLTAIADDRVLQKLNVNPYWETPWVMELTEDIVAQPEGADLALAMDTRAVHADEFHWVREHLADIFLDSVVDDTPTRFSSLLFDNLDVTRIPLGEDPTPAVQHVVQSRADGGSEIRLVEALESLAELDWSESAERRIAFLLVGRVHPAQINLERLHAATLELSRLGVRLHTVSLDPEARTAFLLRDLSLSTNGTWNFIIQPGPPGATDLVGPYELEDLHDLIVSQMRATPTP